jgi:hypothetical protein
MMYANKLAVAIKSNGKVLREFKDTVYVPFGTEYTILLKNLHHVRALVDVSIDGNDIGGGISFVIAGNSEMELERSIANGNMKAGNRFKFIERTAAVEDHRGADVSDGLIRISYQFEKVIHKAVTTTWNDKFYGYRDSGYRGSGGLLGGQWLSNTDHAMYSSNAVGTSCGDFVNSANAITQCSLGTDTVRSVKSANPAPTEVGITVPGSVSDQSFTMTSGFETEYETHVMVIRLLGETESGKPVKQAVTVKAKPRCTSCGHQNKATAKFCTECGTSLQIV